MDDGIGMGGRREGEREGGEDGISVCHFYVFEVRGFRWELERNTAIGGGSEGRGGGGTHARRGVGRANKHLLGVLTFYSSFSIYFSIFNSST